METEIKISKSTDAVIREIQKLDGIYNALVQIIDVEFEKEQYHDLYLKDCLALRSSCLNLVRDLINKQLAETNYTTL